MLGIFRKLSECVGVTPAVLEESKVEIAESGHLGCIFQVLGMHNNAFPNLGMHRCESGCRGDFVGGMNMCPSRLQSSGANGRATLQS